MGTRTSTAAGRAPDGSARRGRAARAAAIGLGVLLALAAPAAADPLDRSFANGRVIVEQVDVDVFGLAGPAVLSDGSIATIWINGKHQRWSSRGRLVGPPGTGYGASDLIRRSDGVFVGSSYGSAALGAVAFNEDLTAHVAFGTGGRTSVTVPGASDVASHALAESVDGSVVVAGRAEIAGAEEFALARFDREGRPDPSFGGDGVVTTRVPGSASRRFDQAGAFDVAALPDGAVVAAGTFRDAATRKLGAAVIRYLPDGSLDPGFGGGDGIVIFAFRDGQPAGARAVALQAAGGETRIMVAGWTGPERTRLFALARLRSDGTLDSSFGSGRPVVTSFWDGEGSDALVTPDGRILVSGAAYMHVPALGLARYTADGRPDRGFGVGGRICTPIPGQMPEPGGVHETSMAIQPDGRLVLGAAYGVDRANLILTRYRPFRLETATCVRVQDRPRRRGAVIRALLGRRARMAIDVAVTSSCGDPMERGRRVGRVRFRPHARGLAKFVWNGRIRRPRPRRGGCYRVTPLLLDARGRVVERFEPGWV